MPDNYITNPDFDTWIANQNEAYEASKARMEALDNIAIAQAAIHLFQLIAYYKLYDDAVDKRDERIDLEIEWWQELEDYKETQDLPMLNAIASVLTNMRLPSINMCSDAVRDSSCAEGDGQAVDDKGSHFVDESCGGLPQGWALHDGSLMAAKSGSYAGGLLANSGKRRVERFRNKKTELVRAGQRNMKSVYKASEVTAMYAQSASIYSGLSDLYIQGFNSAGAGLGVALGQLSNGSQSARGVVQG